MPAPPAWRRRSQRQDAVSWRLLGRLRAERPVALVQQRHAEVEQDLVDLALVLLDQLVELPLPVLVGRTHAHADAIDQLWPGGLLHHRRDMKRAGLLRIQAPHRAPHHAGLDPPTRPALTTP